MTSRATPKTRAAGCDEHDKPHGHVVTMVVTRSWDRTRSRPFGQFGLRRSISIFQNRLPSLLLRQVVRRCVQPLRPGVSPAHLSPRRGPHRVRAAPDSPDGALAPALARGLGLRGPAQAALAAPPARGDSLVLIQRTLARSIARSDGATLRPYSRIRLGCPF